jgi:hypothetical protein
MRGSEDAPDAWLEVNPFAFFPFLSLKSYSALCRKRGAGQGESAQAIEGVVAVGGGEQLRVSHGLPVLGRVVAVEGFKKSERSRTRPPFENPLPS